MELPNRNAVFDVLPSSLPRTIAPQLNGARSIANPHSVPTPSRWHPLPATGANADSAREEYVSVPEVSEVVEVVKLSEVVLWKHRAMVECVGHGKVVWADAMGTAKAMHAAEAVAAHAAHHRVGRHHGHGKHGHHDSASNRYFAEHDNPPDCPCAIMRTLCKT